MAVIYVLAIYASPVATPQNSGYALGTCDHARLLTVRGNTVTVSSTQSHSTLQNRQHLLPRCWVVNGVASITSAKCSNVQPPVVTLENKIDFLSGRNPKGASKAFNLVLFVHRFPFLGAHFFFFFCLVPATFYTAQVDSGNGTFSVTVVARQHMGSCAPWEKKWTVSDAYVRTCIYWV